MQMSSWSTSQKDIVNTKYESLLHLGYENNQQIHHHHPIIEKAIAKNLLISRISDDEIDYSPRSWAAHRYMIHIGYMTCPLSQRWIMDKQTDKHNQTISSDI